ncbi:MAG TPA: ribosome maturation factor RimM [Bacilli bacterium]|nr:ribosome maturation factor RimM [Bacilli bacterium]
MQKINLTDLLIAGYVWKTHSLNGALNVMAITDFPELRFVKGHKFYLVNKTTQNIEKVTLLSVKPHGKRLLLNFKEITSIDHAENYVKNHLYVAKDDVKLPEDYIYLTDLVKYTVYLEDGTYIGQVTEVIEVASYYSIRVKRENKSDLLIPFIDEFIIETNDAEQKIVFRPIEGML